MYELSKAEIENLCNILGDTENGLTGSEIHKVLVECDINDVAENEKATKRERLLRAFTEGMPSENQEPIYQFIEYVMTSHSSQLHDGRFKIMFHSINAFFRTKEIWVDVNGKFHFNN